MYRGGGGWLISDLILYWGLKTLFLLNKKLELLYFIYFFIIFKFKQLNNVQFVLEQLQ